MPPKAAALRKLRRSPPQPMQLEPRFMFDGAAIDTATDTFIETTNALRYRPDEQNSASLPVADTGIREQQPSDQPATTEIAARIVAIDPGAGGYVREYADARQIVFIDSGIQDPVSLIAGAREGLNVFLLGRDSDPWAQMTTVLLQLRDIESVHIASHGVIGALILNGVTYDAQAINEQASLLLQWQRVMTESADILIYGCDVAQSDSGTVLLNSIAQLTQADVAASTDATGATTYGGDWVLEEQTGTVESQVFFDSEKVTYEGVLATPTFSDQTVDLIVSGRSSSAPSNGSLQDAISIDQLLRLAGAADAEGTVVGSMGIAISKISNPSAVDGFYFSTNHGTTWSQLVFNNIATSGSGKGYLFLLNTTDTFIYVDTKAVGYTADVLEYKIWDRSVSATNGTIVEYSTVTASYSGSLSAAVSSHDVKLSLSVTNVSDVPPVNVLPSSISLNEDANFAFTGANTISVSDANNNLIKTRITVNSGTTTLTLGSATLTADESLGSADYEINGTPAQINAALATLVYTPTANYNGTAALTILSQDSTGLTDFDSVAITINAVNDAPVLTAGTVSNLTVNQGDAATTFGLGSVTYGPGGGSDESSQTLTYTVTTLPSAIGTVYLSDGTTAVTTTTYTLAQIQGMKFRPTVESSATGTFIYTVTDSGGTSNGGVNTLTQTINITVVGVNQAPVNTLPSDYTVNQGSTLALSGLSISDTDAGSGTVATTLSVTSGEGTLAGSASAGITLTGSGTYSLTIAGTLSAVNSYLAANSVTYTHAAGLTGAVTLTMATTDNGNTGTGGTKTDSDTVNIFVIQGTNAPVFNSPTADATVYEGVPFKISVNAATDADGDSITYVAEVIAVNGTAVSSYTQLPSWITFDPVTRSLTGIPSVPCGSSLAPITVRITAIDSTGLEGYDDVVITPSTSSLNVSLVFPQVYSLVNLTSKQGSTLYYQEETNSHLTQSAPLVGSNFVFTQVLNVGDAPGAFNGNNVPGILRYINSSGNLVEITGQLTRPIKSPGDVEEGFYFWVDTNNNDDTTHTYSDNYGYILVVNPNYFSGSMYYNSSSDPVDSSLNDVLNQPVYRVSSAVAVEGNNLAFDVTLCGSGTGTVYYEVVLNSYDTASTADIVKKSGSLTFSSSGTQTINVSTIDDLIIENPETLTLNLYNASTGSRIVIDSATGIILDNDTPASFSISDAGAVEGNTITFTVTRTGGTALAQSVDYYTTIAGGDTASASDFTGAAGTLSFAAGETTKTFTVTTTQDTISEGDEVFTAKLANATNGATISDPTGVGTIEDDESSVIYSISDATIAEGGLLTFTVTRSGPVGTVQTVNWATSIESSDTTSVGDFTAASGTLTFATNELSKTFTVQTTADSLYESTETMTATISGLSTVSGTKVSIYDAAGKGYITNDDAVPSISIAGGSSNEGNSTTSPANTITFTITRTGDAQSDQTVTYTTSIASGDSAEQDDFLSTSGTVTFASGETTKTITITLVGDDDYESNETFTVTLSDPTGGASIGTASATGTILNDDSLPPPEIAVTDCVVNEASDIALFRVDATAGGAITLTVTDSTADIVNATQPEIRYSVDGGLTWTTYTWNGSTGNRPTAPGSGLILVSVNIQRELDDVYEISETFTLTAAWSGDAGTATNSGTGTIYDDGTGDYFATETNGDPVVTVYNVLPGSDEAHTKDDDRPTLTISDATMEEGSTLSFSATLSKASAYAEVITLGATFGGLTGDASSGDIASKSSWTVVYSGGTITVASDGSFTLPAGITSFTIKIPTTSDDVYEGAETFTLTANATSSYITDSDTATGTITDDGSGSDGDDGGSTVDDDRPTLTISDATMEEGSTLSFSATLSKASAYAEVITLGATFGGLTGDASSGDIASKSSWTVVYSGGTITVASDGSFTLPAGITSFTIKIPTTSDDVYEGAETFTLTANATSSYITDSDTATGTITDDGSGSDGDDGGSTVDDDRPTLTISDATMEEGSTLSFSATLSKASAYAEVITLGATFGGLTGDASSGDIASKSSWTVVYSGGTITVASDGSFTLPAGITSFTIKIPTTSDDVYEGAETFTLTANATSSYITDSDTATGTITDDGSGSDGDDGGSTVDDDRPTLTISDATMEEGSTLSFSATLSKASAYAEVITLGATFGGLTGDASSGDIASKSSWTVVYSGGTITVASDGSFTLPAGITSFTIKIPTTSDDVYEGAETFTLTANATSSYITDSDTATGTITDDGSGSDGDDGGSTVDDDRPTLTISDATMEEGSTLSFSATLSKASAYAEVITLGATFGGLTGDASSGDIASKSSWTVVYSGGTITVASDGSFTLPAGITSFTIKIPTTSDDVYEGAETFTLTANATSSYITDSDTATGTITDDGSGSDGDDGGSTVDDDRPTLTISDATMEEGSTLSFSATLSKASAYAEVITLGATFGGLTGDASSGDIASKSSWTVVYSGGTITVASDGSFTLPAGITSFTIKIPTTSDDVYEGAETFTLTANATSSYITDSDTATGTITDDGSGSDGDDGGSTVDDDRPTLTISDATMEEGSTLSFSATLSKASAYAEVITLGATFGGLTGDASSGDIASKSSWTVVYSGGTITVASDGSFTLPAGITSFTIKIPTTSDDVYEGAETFTLTANATSSYITDSDTATGTITDDGSGSDGDDGGSTVDDDRPTLTISDATMEEGSTLSFSATLSKASAYAEVITLGATFGGLTGDASSGDIASKSSWTVVYSGGTITVASDGSFTLPAGITSFTIKIPTTSDDVYEGAETFTLTANATSSYITDSDTATGTITDDGSGSDLITVKTLSSGDATPLVGSTVTFRITVTNNGSADATNVSLTESWPSGLTFVSATASGSTSYNSGTGVWTIGSLANGASATLDLNGTVNSASENTSITNSTSRATGDQTDPTTTGDDLEEAVAVDARPVATNDTGTFVPGSAKTITVLTNDTTGDTVVASTVQFTSAGATDSGKTLVVAGEGTWRIDATTGAITFTPLAGFTGNPTAVEYKVADDDGNYATATVTLTKGSADLSTVKTLSSGDATPLVGSTVTFRITVTNNGSADATNVSLTESWPSGLTFVSATASGSTSYNSGTGVWTIGSLANGASATLDLNGTVNSASENTSITNSTSRATGDQTDPTTTGDDLEEAVAVDARPVATNDTGTFVPGSAKTITVLTNDTTGDTVVASTVQFTSAGATDSGKTLVVAGEGTWRIDATTGAITFTPLAGFTGNPTAVEYKVADDDGNYATATVTLTKGRTDDRPPPRFEPSWSASAGTSNDYSAKPQNFTPAILAGEVRYIENSLDRLLEEGVAIKPAELRTARDIPLQKFASSDRLIVFLIPKDTFEHTDAEAKITLTATMVDGTALPTWLIFDPLKGEFRGVAPQDFTGDLIIKILARDDFGRQAETTVKINIESASGRLAFKGKPGLTVELHQQSVFAWKHERDRLLQQMRQARMSEDATERIEKPSEGYVRGLPV